MSAAESIQSTAMEVEVGGYSCAGLKPQNEDAFAARLPCDAGVVNYKGIVACVADGVSCSENAQQASQTSVAQFIDDYYSTPDSWDVKKSAARVLNSLNAWLFHHGQQSYLRHNGLVTTFSGVVLKSNTAHIVHVGDSRIYRFRDNRLQQLTRDHSHKQCGQKSFLTRALGMDSRLEVDYQKKTLAEGDILLLSTDGVHEWLTPAEVIALLNDDSLGLEETARAIVDVALANGSDDNVSCLLVQVNSLPSADVDEVYRRLSQQVIPPAMVTGNKIDHFTVVRVLHSGARSHVYLVEDTKDRCQFVLKAPSENFSEDLQYLEGFVREQWVGRRLNSPNVMKIFEHPSESPFLYHLCEYIDGQTLRQWMHDNHNPDIETVRQLTGDIIKGIRVFQRMSMVHRDLKPENIMITASKRVVIIDFGTVQADGLNEISSVVSEEAPVGTVDYIAPEYLRGEKGLHCSDIFSIGVMVYEMLTGVLPYKISAIQQCNPQRHQGWRYCSARSLRKDIPVWLDLTLEKACAELPAQRYHVMSEFLLDLTTPNATMVFGYESAPLLRRNPVLFWQWVSTLMFVAMVVEGWLLSRG